MTKRTAISTVLAMIAFCASFAGLASSAQAVTCKYGDAQCAAMFPNGTECPISGPEDQPGWNWAKCGNHTRGVTDLFGNFKVVGVCEFNRLWAYGAIRSKMTFDGKLYTGLHENMRGDSFARTLTDCPWRNRLDKPFPWAQSPHQWALNQGRRL